MIALLQEVPVGGSGNLALRIATLKFIGRERGLRPAWFVLGPGVELKEGESGMLGLERVELECRAGCVMVGRGRPM